jgi:hypothetical protein
MYYNIQILVMYLINKYDVPVESQRHGWQDGTWQIFEFTTFDLRGSNDPDRLFRNTSITHQWPRFPSTYQYYPCLDGQSGGSTRSDHPSSEYIALPVSGVDILVPMTVTVCRAKTVRCHVTISHAGASEHVSYVIRDAESIPVYTSALNKFNGSLEQLADLSGAVSLYMDFTSNLHKSYSISQSVPFEYPKTPQTTKPYTLDDGMIVQTCELSLGTMMSTGEVAVLKYEIWPLSVFERRLGFKRSVTRQTIIRYET